MFAWLSIGLLGVGTPPITVSGDSPPPPPPGFSVRELGTVTTGESIAFEVGEETTALQLYGRLRSPRRRHKVGFAIHSPDGAEHLAGRRDAEVSFHWPATPEQAELGMDGRWEVETYGVHGGLVDVSLLEWADSDPDRGTLHVQVVYTDGVATPAIEADVHEAIALWQAMWAPYGLSVAPYFQFSTAPSSCPSAWPSRGSPVYEALSAAGAPHDLTLVVCDRLANGNPLGISYSGPLLASPEAVVAVRVDPGKPGRLGQTMAHEVGHYLGLVHPKEDQLEDTPECDPDRDILACQNLLGRNLMYETSICPAPLDRIEGAEEVDGCLLQDQLTEDQLVLLHRWIGTTE